MGEGIEGLGEAVTGGLAGRAVEPAAGESGEHAAPANCLNCATPLEGEFCHSCGQRGYVHRTLTAWWHDIAHGVLHLDGKIWRTLPLLALKPGELTRRYIAGERAKFVSPIALFLFSVFLMFAVFSAVGGPFGSSDGDPSEPDNPAQELRQAQQNLARATAERARLAAARQDTSEADDDIRDANLEIRLARMSERLQQENEAREAAGEGEEKQGNLRIARTGWPRLDSAIEKAERNPSLLVYKIQANGYKFSWALIPISVPFVWLLFFWQRKHRMYDHTVFVTYSIAFMSLGLIALTLLRPLGAGEAIIGIAISFVPPMHMYKQLRGAYGLTRFGAIWRTVFLNVFALIASLLFLLLLLALGALA